MTHPSPEPLTVEPVTEPEPLGRAQASARTLVDTVAFLADQSGRYAAIAAELQVELAKVHRAHEVERAEWHAEREAMVAQIQRLQAAPGEDGAPPRRREAPIDVVAATRTEG